MKTITIYTAIYQETLDHPGEVLMSASSVVSSDDAVSRLRTKILTETKWYDFEGGESTLDSIIDGTLDDNSSAEDYHVTDFESTVELPD